MLSTILPFKLLIKLFLNCIHILFCFLLCSLVCAVSYLSSNGEQQNFRKFFKFQVMKPLDVKTKFYNAEVSDHGVLVVASYSRAQYPEARETHSGIKCFRSLLDSH